MTTIRKDGVLESQPVLDHFTSGQTLADQSGAGGVLTFTFSKTMNLVWVFSLSGVSRADPFGGTPSASQGIYCDAGIATPISVDTTSVKVFAPNGSVVSVWGFSYT